jgi:hypothetical protein
MIKKFVSKICGMKFKFQSESACYVGDLYIIQLGLIAENLPWVPRGRMKSPGWSNNNRVQLPCYTAAGSKRMR